MGWPALAPGAPERSSAGHSTRPQGRLVSAPGVLSQYFALDATVTGMPADLLRLVVPGPALSGTLGAEARLTGAVDSPTGSVRVRAEGLRLTEGAGRSLSPASILVTAQLAAAGFPAASLTLLTRTV